MTRQRHRVKVTITVHRKQTHVHVLRTRHQILPIRTPVNACNRVEVLTRLFESLQRSEMTLLRRRIPQLKLPTNCHCNQRVVRTKTNVLHRSLEGKTIQHHATLQIHKQRLSVHIHGYHIPSIVRNADATHILTRFKRERVGRMVHEIKHRYSVSNRRIQHCPICRVANVTAFVNRSAQIGKLIRKLHPTQLPVVSKQHSHSRRRHFFKITAFSDFTRILSSILSL